MSAQPEERPDAEQVHDRLRRFWDRDAAIYDRSPSHAASDPVEAAAWRAALLRHLPPPGASVLDAGAGTGTMSLLMAELGYRVTALDLSPGMLGVARRKAAALGLEVQTVVAEAGRPPSGPFDAVVARHLLWTLPDPVRTLAAWRRVVPQGRAVLYEGLWGDRGVLRRVRFAFARVLRRWMRIPEGHHGEYDPDLRAALPLAGGITPPAVIEVLGAAGYRRVRVERLRDVEWARRVAGDPLLGRLETVARFAVLAEP